MFIGKNISVIKRFLWFFCLLVGVGMGSLFYFSKPAEAAPTVYYFNNAVNNDPTELGNYWYDAGLTDPASELPDLSEDVLHVVSGAEYNGNAVFRGSGTNAGAVIGNADFYDAASNLNDGTVGETATFWEDFSENNGATFLAVRRYTQSVVTLRSFDFPKYGKVIADNAVVNINDANFDNNISFETIGTGYFIADGYFYLNDWSFTAGGNKVSFLFNTRLQYPMVSVPDVEDFEVTVNGQSVPVTNVESSEALDVLQKGMIVLTLSHDLAYDDEVEVSYTMGDHLILNQQGINALDFSGTVSRYDHAIPTGEAPVYSTLVGTKLYVSNNHSANLTVIDTMTDQVVATIPVGAYPELSVVMDTKLYVNNLISNSVSVVDTTTDSVVKTITGGGLNGPYFSTVVGTKIYISNTNSNTVSVIDTATDTITATITVGSAPWFSGAVGHKLYVPNRTSNNVSVIDTITDTVIATVPTPDGSLIGTKALVIGDKIYVGKASAVAVIDSVTDTVLTNITVGTNFAPYFSCAVGTKMYVVNRGDNNKSVSIIDTVTNTVIGSMVMGGPSYVGGNLTTCMVIGSKVYLTREGPGAFVLDSPSANLARTIEVIDSLTDTLVESIPVNFKPFYATVGPNHKLYVSNNDASSISVIQTTDTPFEHPSLLSFSTTAANGTYTTGQVIPITAHFGQTLLAGSTMTVTLNTGASVVLNNISGTTLSGNYTIAGGQTTPDLSVTAVTSASVSDLSSHTRTSYVLPSSQGDLVAENSFITRNLGDSKDIVIGSYLSVPVGANPYQLTAPITIAGVAYTYVANQGDATVSVIRLSDRTVIATIPVGSEPYGLAAVTISGITYVYVANTGSNTVSVINTSTNTVAATIEVGVKPYYVAAIGSKVYVTNSLSNTVSVIDAFTNSVTATIAVGTYPRGIKASGTDLYVANYGDPNYSGGNSITVINSLTNTVTHTIISPAGSDGPRGVNVLGSNVYVTNFRSNNVSVIDTATKAITHTIAVGRGPRGVIGLGSKVYIENFDDGTMSVIDTGTNTVTATVQVGNAPSGISADGTDLYLTRFQDNSVSILNTLTNTLRPAPAIIASLGPSFLGPTTATITASTTTPTTAVLEYGPTSDYGQAIEIPTLATTSNFTLIGLTPRTTYHYRLTVTDADTNVTASADHTLTTTGGSYFFPNPLIPADHSGTLDLNVDDDVLDGLADPAAPPPSTVDQSLGFFCPGWSRAQPSATTSFIERIKGLFLLSVEDRGSLWYVNTSNGLRYEVNLPTALCLFQLVSRGISNQNIETIPQAGSDIPPSSLGKKMRGSILIQPYDLGKTWYVDMSGFRHRLVISNLLDIAKHFALGITRADINQISIGSERK